MSIKAIPIAVAVALAGGSLLPSSALAAVGEQINKSMSQTVNLPDGIPAGTPEADHAFVKYMRFYVPAQDASGVATTVPYNLDDGIDGDSVGELVKEKTVAKPLISVFLYGPAEGAEAVGDENAGGFVGHGHRDAYGAISLDDGQTWKQFNLSESATQSSLTVANPAPGVDAAYPGDVTNIVHAVAGNKVVAAWQSRYCSTGSPGYNVLDSKPELADYLGIDPDFDLYLSDVFGVAGSQGSVDYSADYPTVGEVPFNCLWTARGVLVAGDDPRTAQDEGIEGNHIVWYAPERLTSGRRDVNRIEIQAVAGAGFALTWQEDPEGLRPGSGEGPGEGWSGAIGNSQTDIWYSFLPWAHVETVDDEGTPVDLATYWVDGASKPQPYVPFAVPMRLTNNAKCNLDGTSGDNPEATAAPYCTAEAANYGLPLQCTAVVEVPQGQNRTGNICVNENGLPNLANTAATRARLSLQPRIEDVGGVDTVTGAWAVVIAEESKGMGRFGFTVDDPTVTCELPPPGETSDTCVVADDGKDIRYFSFEMGSAITSADLSDTGLVANLVNQGDLVNQPETDWRTGALFPLLDTTEMWDFGAYNFEIYRTEIARRGSLLVQPTAHFGANSLSAMLLFKQGLLNQGGPADIMARRLVDGTSLSDNPYDFRNMACSSWAYDDGSNPYYPHGVCLDPATNMSGVTPEVCTTGGGGDNDVSDGVCPTVDGSNIASQDPADQTAFDKVTNWIQCPGSPECGNFPESVALGSNLDDQSWYNPLDVAKGHRGYLWGDLAVVMYAWSPNWKLNTTGSDRYELYIRRSFDAGATWTTTPAGWGGDGTTTCETMRDGETSADQSQVCTDYAAGAPEQARNVSQLRSLEQLTPTNRYTVLDPRYAPDPPTMPSIGADGDANYDYDTDEFNPSRFFVVYETGDNTTVAVGEAEPLNLYYGRAVNFGDDYQVWADEADMVNTCIDTNLGTSTGAGVFCNEFDRLTVGSNVEASEASLAMSPAGDTVYSVWSQVDGDTLVSDAAYARVWYDDPNFEVSIDGTPVTPPEPPASGDDPFVPGDPQDPLPPADEPGNGGGSGIGCSIGNANAAFDPLLPGLVLAALGYLGLRRRMGKLH